MTSKHRGTTPIKKAAALVAAVALVGVGAALAVSAPAQATTDAPRLAAATAPTFNDPCGTDKDGYLIPDFVEHVIYTDVDRRTNGVGTVNITATSEVKYTLDDQGHTSQTWAKEFTNTQCTVTPAAQRTTESYVPAAPSGPSAMQSIPKDGPAPLAAAPKGELAFTGAEPWMLPTWVFSGLAVLLGGFLLMVRSTRKTKTQA